MKRYCFALDLKDEPGLIREYIQHHQHIWPEIIQSLKSAGIHHAEIYRTGPRLFMILETNELFTLDKKTTSDLLKPKVQEWEALMWNYQQALPNAKPGQKWVLMDKIFSL